MRSQATQFFEAAVPSQPTRVSHELAETRMIGMLIRDQAGREHNAGTFTSQNPGKFDRVGGLCLKMRISI
jgi:hypothetical protein